MARSTPTQEGSTCKPSSWNVNTHITNTSGRCSGRMVNPIRSSSPKSITQKPGRGVSPSAWDHNRWFHGGLGEVQRAPAGCRKILPVLRGTADWPRAPDPGGRRQCSVGTPELCQSIRPHAVAWHSHQSPGRPPWRLEQLVQAGIHIRHLWPGSRPRSRDPPGLRYQLTQERNFNNKWGICKSHALR